MPKYDVFVKGKKVKVSKNLTDTPSQMDGFDYVGSLIGSTKVNALTQAKAKVQSGLMKVEKVIEEKNEETFADLPKEVKKAIYCDFNGVVDDREREANATNSSREPAFYLPEIACPDKIFKLIKLAIDNNADLILTSLWRFQGMDWYIIIARCLRNSENQEYIDYLKENIDAIQDLCGVAPTGDSGSRTDEIAQHIKSNNYTHFVVFEDDHYIAPELNPIMVDWTTGLLDSHIQSAYQILEK